MKKLAFFILLSLVTLGVFCTNQNLKMECECGVLGMSKLVW